MNLTHDRSVQVGLRCGWRALKWAGTAMCLLTAAALLYSTRRAVIWDSRTLRYEVAVIVGGGAFGWRPEGWRPDDEQYPPDPGWTVAKSDGELEWWPQRTRNKHWESVFLPLWIPLATVMLPTGGLWYRDRDRFHSDPRSDVRRCLHCRCQSCRLLLPARARSPRCDRLRRRCSGATFPVGRTRVGLDLGVVVRSARQSDAGSGVVPR